MRSSDGREKRRGPIAVKGREWRLSNIKGSKIFFIGRERHLLPHVRKSACRYRQSAKAQAGTDPGDRQDAARGASGKDVQFL